MDELTKTLYLKHLKKLADRTGAEVQTLGTSVAAAIKSGKVENNSIKLYTSTDMTGTAAISMDLPVEYLLDQAKTQFVAKFTWSEAAYPGSTDPSLNNKPVMVLAVKGSDNSTAYSFLNMATLVDTYTAKATGKDASTTVTVSGYEIEVAVNISTVNGNLLEKKTDGLYVGADSSKADKDADAVVNNFAMFDANGNPVDSGKKASDFSKVAAGTNQGQIKIDGTDTTVVEYATDAEVDAVIAAAFGDTAGGSGEA